MCKERAGRGRRRKCAGLTIDGAVVVLGWRTDRVAYMTFRPAPPTSAAGLITNITNEMGGSSAEGDADDIIDKVRCLSLLEKEAVGKESLTLGHPATRVERLALNSLIFSTYRRHSVTDVPNLQSLYFHHRRSLSR